MVPLNTGKHAGKNAFTIKSISGYVLDIAGGEAFN